MLSTINMVHIAAVGLFLLLFMGRSVELAVVKKTRVFALVVGKPATEATLEAVFILTFPLWIALAVVTAIPISSPTLGGGIGLPLALRYLGLVMEVTSVGLFAWSLASFGQSWRVGIDRARPGELVTGGAFSWSRNPIFLALDLLVVGAFFATGHPALGVIALVAVLALHRQIRAEERYLVQLHGEDYHAWCRRVRRYFGRYGVRS